jgi:hypothetical protein
MTVPELRKEDLEAPRTQQQLSDWVGKVLAAFGSSPEGKSAFRLNKSGLVKQLVEELLPLKRFAEGFYPGDPEIQFRLVVGNQSYDALVESQAQPVTYLQITQAFDGYESYLRKLHLDQNKSVVMTRPAPIKDKRTGRTSQGEGFAVDHDEVLAKTFQDIRAAVERKSAMRYELDTALIVNVESFHFLDEADVEALHVFVRREVTPLARNFRGLYLVSDRQGFAYAYPTVSGRTHQ